MRSIREALRQIADIADEIGDLADLVRVHIEDADVLSAASSAVDPHRMTDRVRYLTAAVLNLLYERRMGPPIAQWATVSTIVVSRTKHERAFPETSHGCVGCRPGHHERSCHGVVATSQDASTTGFPRVVNKS